MPKLYKSRTDHADVVCKLLGARGVHALRALVIIAYFLCVLQYYVPVCQMGNLGHVLLELVLVQLHCRIFPYFVTEY